MSPLVKSWGNYTRDDYANCGRAKAVHEGALLRHFVDHASVTKSVLQFS